MTILCPAEFAAATTFAVEADDALLAEIARTGDTERRSRLKGQATKTLLACFGARARSDDIDNKNPNFPPDSEVRYADGRVRTIRDLGEYERPIRETFIFKDMAPHSFFFREEWLDPATRQRVELYDDCWYVFAKLGQAEADAIPEDELPQRVGDDVKRSFTEPYARAVRNKIAASGGTGYIRRVKQRRTGMCGGIIWHAVWDGGQPAPYGSWSTHT